MKKIFIALACFSMFSQVWVTRATPPKPGYAHNFRAVNFPGRFIPEQPELIFVRCVPNPLQPNPIELKNIQGSLVAIGAIGSTKVLEKYGMPAELSPLTTLALSVVGYSLCPNKQWGKDINQAILIFSGYKTIKNVINYFWEKKPQEKPS